MTAAQLITVPHVLAVIVGLSALEAIGFALGANEESTPDEAGARGCFGAVVAMVLAALTVKVWSL